MDETEKKEIEAGCLALYKAAPQIATAMLFASKNDVKASDLHLSEGGKPWLRRGGSFARSPELSVISREEIEVFTEWVGGDRVCETKTFFLPDYLNPGAGFDVPNRWRIQTWHAQSGIKASMRLLATNPPPFEVLGTSIQGVKQVLNLGSGLVIFAGATGSGKTTTMAAVLSLMNAAHERHIITIENPVEYLYTPDLCLIEQQEVGIDVPTAQTAFVDALRSDPDVIVLGELREPDEAALCLEAAASGHLVITTMHAQNAGLVCERLLADQGESGRSKLAQAFQMIVAQRLVPDKENPQERRLYAEILVRDDPIVKEIRPGGDFTKLDTAIKNVSNGGLDRELAEGVLKGEITRADAERAVISKKEFLSRLAKATSRQEQV